VTYEQRFMDCIQISALAIIHVPACDLRYDIFAATQHVQLVSLPELCLGTTCSGTLRSGVALFPGGLRSALPAQAAGACRYGDWRCAATAGPVPAAQWAQRLLWVRPIKC
jgi:hypothetical protein